MCGSKLALQTKNMKSVLKRFLQSSPSYVNIWLELPCGEHFATVGTRVAEVFNALVDYLDVTVKVAFFAEYLIALRTSGWLVDLDVQMHLGEKLSQIMLHQQQLVQSSNHGTKFTNLSTKLQSLTGFDVAIGINYDLAQ